MMWSRCLVSLLAMTALILQSPHAQATVPSKDKLLNHADFERAAAALKCDVAAIYAVAEIESSRGGFLPSGRPVILFEAHIFSGQTKGKHDASHPDISSPKWNRSIYKGGEKEHDRLDSAMKLDKDAALRSASWGRFQIMGFNHKAAGYAKLDDFIAAMHESEGKHLDAFVSFLKTNRLDAPLREKRWTAFAEGYNGKGQAKNQYDKKLERAYEKHAKLLAK
ncbi:MAG: N-acetylmuramidase family protein [Gemmataceae bacterium]